MRFSIPARIFAAFLSVLLVTSIMAYSVWVGIGGMRKAAKDFGDLKDFQTSLRGLELFNWGPEARMPSDRKERFEARFKDLLSRTESLKSLSASMPAEITDNLPLLEEQSVYFRQAYEELLLMQEKDEELHQLQHRLMEELAVKFGENGNDELRRDFSKILYYWGRAYHDRDIDSINGLHTLLEEALTRTLRPDVKNLLEESSHALDKNYLNYLALVERENFLAGTTKRYVQVSNQALEAIINFQEGRQTGMLLLLGVALTVSVLLTLFYWIRATRYVSAFLDDSRKMVSSIRQGEEPLSVRPRPDDEFGDLLSFMREIGLSLKDSMSVIRASEEKYRTLVEELADWVWETDAEGKCIYSGPVGGRMLGLPQSSIDGRAMADLLCSGDNCEEIQLCLETMRSKSSGSGLISFAKLPGGECVALESSFKPITTPSGDFAGLRGITRDVTERLSLEAEKRAMQSQLMHAQKMEAIGTLSGGVAHDFNNLLQSMGGYADILLKRGNLNEDDRATVTRMAQTAVSAAKLTQQLLIFSRRAETLMAPLDINAEIQKVCAMMERIIPKEIALAPNLADGLPLIRADQMQIEQILMNLIINARDAIDGRGRIEISTRCEEENGKRLVVLTVADNGRGMTAEVRQRIFEPFFTTKAPGKGTGLGLSIVYGIAEAHGAKLTCESQVGRGAAFELRFPALAGEEGAAFSASESGEDQFRERRSLSILVVDDEQPILESCAEILTLEGYRTTTATSGEEAVEIYTRSGAGRFDLVILDISMPGMGGLECLRKIRAIRPDQVIILASGYADADQQNPDGKKQANAFLKKPYRLRTLLETVRAVTP